MKIEKIESEIVEEFDMFDNWEEKYQYLIDMGRDLEVLPNEFKTDDRIIKGCQSKVWLNSELKEGKIIYKADSDAIITKGMVALMIRVLSNQIPDDIVNAKMEFVDKIGLKEHLSPTRANGLVNMIKQMKLDAMALKTQIK